ncbi:MAG: DUF2064 domain-containing protein [Actinomycetota bacterium]|nr:DUF2064 domain-containing protein [Actinomycetota bacterium]
MNPLRHLLVMAKSPVPGQVKTRLCPPCSPEEAAEVAAAALADTLDAVAACRADRKILALAGEPGPWLPPGFQLIPQRGVTLGQRLANAWTDADGPGIQIGMDTPQVRPEELDALLTALEGPGRRAVLGLADDGGWWVIGWRHPGLEPATVFDGIPMSTSQTGALQGRRLRRLGCQVFAAGQHRDIDTAADLTEVAGLAPNTRTAAVARRIGLAAQVV